MVPDDVRAQFVGSPVEPFNFPCQTGLGLRARREIAAGEVVLSFGNFRELVITAARARKLLASWLTPPQDPARPPLTSIEGLVVGQIVCVLADEAKVLSACRDCGISVENDGDRRAVLGACLRIRELDPSDDTVALEGHQCSEVWLPVRALTSPLLHDAVTCLKREDALTLCLFHLRRSGASLGVSEELMTWVSNLPDRTNCPLFWNEHELAELEGSNYAPRARGLRHQAQSAYLALSMTFGVEAVGSFEDYMCALSLVRSRVFTITPQHFQSVTEKEDVAMLPFFDYANHDPGLAHVEGNIRESADGETLSFHAIHDTPAGCELFNSYGLKPSCELLLGWGFVPARNPHDHVELEITVQRAIATETERVKNCLVAIHGSELSGVLPQAEILQMASDVNPLQIRVLLRAERPLPSALLSLCRLEKLSPSALFRLTQNLGKLELERRLLVGEPLLGSLGCDKEDAQIWQMAEMNCLNELCMIFEAMLNQYPNTDEDDAMNLKLDPEAIGIPRFLAISLRRSEKTILHAALRSAKALHGDAKPTWCA